MHVDTPVGNTLPDMVITVIVCVIVEKIAAAVKEKEKYNNFQTSSKRA